MENKWDFSGWATKCNVRCSDGRTIMKDAFAHNDGCTVPMVWNHRHDGVENVLGHALLKHHEKGVLAYGKFNDTPQGKIAKVLVDSGDITSLSIFANRLKEEGKNVVHGDIKEVSLVLAGANPEAFIDSVMCHDDDSGEAADIYTGGEGLTLWHSDDDKDDPNEKEKIKMGEENDKPQDEGETMEDIFNTLSEKQKDVVYALVGMAAAENEKNEGGNDMKHNVFDTDNDSEGGFLSHSDETNIINLAKSNGVGSLRTAISIYSENNDTLAHGIDDIESLFPDYKDATPGAPEMITRDQGWVSAVMNKAHKSPIARVRTRQADARLDTIRAYGYEKGKKKKVAPNIKLLKRTTDPQTVYRKDALNRDDILDIQDFDVVNYTYNLMRLNLNEELATAIMIGDGREDGDEDKIDESHIRPIWHDDELYTIHTDVDVEAAKAELNGTGTGVSFGDNYVYSEAIIAASLYSREQYRGSGSMDMFCTPHLLNVMLLARDMNGRRIYNSKADLAAALNVNEIHTVEQFEGKTRTTTDGKVKKLLGIFVNLADYQIGSVKGGEITKFQQFDIDFNQEKFLIETRVSGALTKVYSAIALEEDVTSVTSSTSSYGS